MIIPESGRDDWTPSGWDVSGSTRQIYRQVVAGYCRTCHISHRGIHFGSYGDFASRGTAILAAVCGEQSANIMPNAEATSKAFWRSSARARLVNRANFPGCGLLGPNVIE